MNLYALTLVIKNDLDEKNRQALLVAVTQKFNKLTKEEIWGSRNLAYPIKHQEKGFYAYYEFEAEPDIISSLDNMIKLNDDILRHLLIRAERRLAAQEKIELSGKDKQSTKKEIEVKVKKEVKAQELDEPVEEGRTKKQ